MLLCMTHLLIVRARQNSREMETIDLFKWYEELSVVCPFCLYNFIKMYRTTNAFCSFIEMGPPDDIKQVQ